MSRFNTGIEATAKNLAILSSVMGQMSDGIWENTRAMEKYWKSLSVNVDAKSNKIIIEDIHNVCDNPAEFMANKIKQVIKREIEWGGNLTWDRNCSEVSDYLSRHNCQVTVGDCYKLYDQLKGRSIAKNTYTDTKIYNVNVSLNGQTITISDLEATSIYEAKDKAKQLIIDNARFTVAEA